MAVDHGERFCKKCGKRIGQIVDVPEDAPPGDYFVDWDYEGHKCKSLDLLKVRLGIKSVPKDRIPSHERFDPLS